MSVRFWVKQLVEKARVINKPFGSHVTMEQSPKPEVAARTKMFRLRHSHYLHSRAGGYLDNERPFDAEFCEHRVNFILWLLKVMAYEINRMQIWNLCAAFVENGESAGPKP